MHNFSVLLSVYHKETPIFLTHALHSIWDNQTLKPSEIVIVKDGLLTKELDAEIEQFSQKAPVKVISLKHNVGLGPALAAGLLECSNELVARMDSDDVSYPNRFEKQIPLMEKGYDVVSSWSIFFENTLANIIATKKRPERHEKIMKLAKKRSPVCHASCILRKSKVLEAGNYRNYPYYEDYDLWVRMLLNGSKFYNLQDYVYYVRGSLSQFGRRGGLSYLKTEIKVHRNFRKVGFLTRFELMRNVMIRIVIRVLPVSLRKNVYMLIWKKSKIQ